MKRMFIFSNGILLRRQFRDKNSTNTFTATEAIEWIQTLLPLFD
jgi:hypothetical protein